MAHEDFITDRRTVCLPLSMTKVIDQMVEDGEYGSFSDATRKAFEKFLAQKQEAPASCPQ